MPTKSEHYGKAVLRWQLAKDGGFEGTVISAGKRGEIFSDENEDRLVARLRNEAGKLEPNYVGMDGAIARFLEFMPGGLRGERSVSEERDYKLAAVVSSTPFCRLSRHSKPPKRMRQLYAEHASG